MKIQVKISMLRRVCCFLVIGCLMCHPATVQAASTMSAQLMQTSDGSVEADEENSAQELSAVKQSDVKKAYIVANKKARIDWTKSKGADGYVLYRRTADTKQWTKIAVLTGMTWDKSSYPKVSGKDYSYQKIDAAYNGYKVMRVYNKLFGANN